MNAFCLEIGVLKFLTILKFKRKTFKIRILSICLISPPSELIGCRSSLLIKLKDFRLVPTSVKLLPPLCSAVNPPLRLSKWPTPFPAMVRTGGMAGRRRRRDPDEPDTSGSRSRGFAALSAMTAATSACDGGGQTECRIDCCCTYSQMTETPQNDIPRR